MSGRWFDDLARILAVGMPRRAVLRTVVAASAAALDRRRPVRAAPSGCKQFCHFFTDLDPGECQGECARCEGRGREFCGIGFHDRPFCCPAGEVCLQQQECCPRERVCRYAGSIVSCCAPGANCVEGNCVPG